MSATAIIKQPSLNARILHTHTTRYNADVVAALPHSTVTSPPLVAIGNYQLQQDTGHKTGCISLCRLHDAAVEQVHTEDTAAIFDLRWSPQLLDGKSLLAVADGDGALTVHELQHSSSSLSSLVTASAPFPCLYVDWDNSLHPSSSPSLAVSLSNGSVCLYSLSPSSPVLTLLSTFSPHTLEAWCCAFSPFSPSTLYTGGDDCALVRIDTRSRCPAVVSSITPLHSAGVTAILPSSSSSSPHRLLTGCYDDRLRVWDDRMWRRTVGELGLGGGVWRLRWRMDSKGQHSGDSAMVCAACMHGGVKVVRMGAVAGEDMEVVSAYHGHDSMAYGCDWIQSAASEHDTIVSCSFYDNAVHVWQPLLPSVTT
jgi:diphthine methyl ester acylhydrolase